MQVTQDLVQGKFKESYETDRPKCSHWARNWPTMILPLQNSGFFIIGITLVVLSLLLATCGPFALYVLYNCSLHCCKNQGGSAPLGSSLLYKPGVGLTLWLVLALHEGLHCSYSSVATVVEFIYNEYIHVVVCRGSRRYENLITNLAITSFHL